MKELKEKQNSNNFIPGETTIYNAQLQNMIYKSEIDEYLNRIWDLQTNLSQKEEDMRILKEKNNKLENELENLKNEINKNKEIKELKNELKKFKKISLIKIKKKRYNCN